MPGPGGHEDRDLRGACRDGPADPCGAWDGAHRDQLRRAIVIWIEKINHRWRRQDTLGRMTPIEYENITQAAHAA